jgi:hypothetical protein
MQAGNGEAGVQNYGDVTWSVWRSSGSGLASYGCSIDSSSVTSDRVSTVNFRRAPQRVELGCELIEMGKSIGGGRSGLFYRCMATGGN